MVDIPVVGRAFGTPLIAFHVLQFSKPGLLPSEYTSLRRWMITTALP